MKEALTTPKFLLKEKSLVKMEIFLKFHQLLECRAVTEPVKTLKIHCQCLVINHSLNFQQVGLTYFHSCEIIITNFKDVTRHVGVQMLHHFLK